MKNLKTYEGFFDFLKSKPSADDEIALEYIKRLKKVKGLSPYKITLDEGNNNNEAHKVNKWLVDFEDTPVKLWEAVSFRNLGFEQESQLLLLNKKLIKISNKEFIGINVICEGEAERCAPKAKIAKELLDLVKSVYENDKETRRIEKIKINMNKAADLIEDENENEN
jgi:hypothetical protein